MNTATEGMLCLVLHAHLPYVRHQDDPDALELRWLFEAITETYLPLIESFNRLANDNIPVHVTMSLTPTLVSMLRDPLLQHRYLSYLNNLLELTEKEIRRTSYDLKFHSLALYYNGRIKKTLAYYRDTLHCDPVAGFARLARSGVIELISSCATHGFLPLLGINETSARAQVALGSDFCSTSFGFRPDGFWLPECGYSAGLDPILRAAGIRYTFLDAHGVRNADPRPVHDVYAPVITPDGLIVFPRDPQSSRQVWSSADGYPGDPDYREYYKDIGHELELEYIRPHIHPKGIRVDTGIKYWRITGDSSQKEPYDIEKARQKAELHARDFLDNKKSQCSEAFLKMDRAPLIVAPFDAELFGHWWHEGPVWLESLLRQMHGPEQGLRPVTPAEYLAEHPVCQLSRPSASTWGQGGYSEVWLNKSNDWICQAIHNAGSRMRELAARRGQGEASSNRRSADQAARELLLAEASDWPFILKTGTTVAYATHRIRTHLDRFNRICDDIENGSSDPRDIKSMEADDAIFPGMACSDYYRNPPDMQQRVRTSRKEANRPQKSPKEDTGKRRRSAAS